jgi:5-methylcytosine-specific restriction endonuclease McrA
MRHNFSSAIKRAARKRSGDRCEAIGEVYGLPAGQRCNAVLTGKRVEIDHYPIPATDEGSDVLENAVTCCTDCHSHKTTSYDIPMQAKGKRVSDKHLGIRRPSQWAKPAKRKAPPQKTASRKIEKWSLV